MEQSKSLIQQAQSLINQAKSRGETPVCFTMCRRTADLVMDETNIGKMKAMNLLERLATAFRPRRRRELTNLHGLPVQINPNLPIGLIGLQGARLMPKYDEPGALARENTQARESKSSEETAVKLDDLSGDMSPTSVLIKAMDGIDSFRGIVVLRVGPKGVDMCTNLSKFELQGVLHHGMIWAAQQD